MNNVELEVGDLLDHLRMSGMYNQYCREVVIKKQAVQVATDKGIQVSDDELQTAADRFRRENGLEKAETFHDWLNVSGLDAARFETCLKEDILLGKLGQSADEGQLDDEDLENLSGGLTLYTTSSTTNPTLSTSTLPLTSFYTSSTPIPSPTPTFDPYASENAVAGVRG